MKKIIDIFLWPYILCNFSFFAQDIERNCKRSGLTDYFNQLYRNSQNQHS